MKYDYILFDFDGTLFDTSEGILKGIRRALEEAGIPVGEDAQLYKFIGPPVVQALKEFCGMTEEEAQHTKKVYREYYQTQGIWQCRPIDGAEACLQKLTEAGFTCYGAVNSPYVWLTVPAGMTSWEFFDDLLDKCQVVGTPGSGFGKCGEGYFRLTARFTARRHGRGPKVRCVGRARSGACLHRAEYGIFRT